MKTSYSFHITYELSLVNKNIWNTHDFSERRNDDISVRQTWSRQHNFRFRPSQQFKVAACNSFDTVVLVTFRQQVSNYLSSLMESTAAQLRIAPPVSISSSCNLYKFNAWAPGEVSTHSCNGEGWTCPFRLVLRLMFTASNIGCFVDSGKRKDKSISISLMPFYILCLLFAWNNWVAFLLHLDSAHALLIYVCVHDNNVSCSCDGRIR